MAGKKKDKVEEVSVVVVPKKELILEGNPKQQMAFAVEAANALMDWVKNKPKPVMINGEQYLEFGDWQILARFYGATVGVEWARPYEEEGKQIGWEARAVVYRDGVVISAAEAMCTNKEKRWGTRRDYKSGKDVDVDDFQRRSMAQTRASAKALRQAFGWVAELAGLKSTPAEEMGAVYDTTPIPAKVVPVVHTTDHEEPPSEDDLVPLPLEEVSVSATINKQRQRIKDLLDSHAGAQKELLVTKEDYEKACLKFTGIELQMWNFPTIIERLESIPL